MNWPPVAEPAPKILVLPPAAADLGEADAAIELWEHYSGKTLDPDQRIAVYVMMAQGADGKWAATTTGREKPRQNGKGDEIEVVELWGLVQRAEAILHTVHDAVMLSTQTQQRLLGVLEGHGDLRRRIAKVWKGTGQQMIEFRNGGVIWYRTRTAKGGLGVDDVTRLVIDEAQEATKEQVAATSPTQMVNPDRQINALGTSGKAGVSRWWWGMRRRALGADPGAFGYVGTTAETVYLDDEGRVVQVPVNVEDRALWLAVNPAVRAGRGGGMAFLEDQYKLLDDPRLYAREHLGVWDPPDDEDEREPIVDLKAWKALEDVPGERPARIALAVAATQDRGWSHIGLAGERSDGRIHLQVIKSGRGTGWVLDELARLKREWKPTRSVIGSGDPASSLLSEAKPALRLRPIQAPAQARAAGMLVDGVAEGTISHGGDPRLLECLRHARKKDQGKSFLLADPPDGAVDIAPLRAVAHALHALRSSRRGDSTPRRAVVL